MDETIDDCREVPARGTPLVVDWKMVQRTDLEVALSQSIAVVAYDCGGLTLLPDCQLPGSYGYVGVSRSVDVIQLQDKDEIHANLPAFGAELMGQVERQAAFDLAMVMVGKKRTVISSAQQSELRGPGCRGATHFVRGAYLGAFALETGTAGEIAAAAEILGRGSRGKSEARRRRLRSAGDPDACKTASLSADTPPDDCGSVLRLELQALGVANTASADLEVGACPEGLIAEGGKCVRVAGKRSPVCSLEEPAGCAGLCEQGNMTSCSILGYAHHYALSGVKKDLKRAGALYRRACDAGIQNACSGLGSLLETGKGGLTQNLPRAIELHERACAAGDSRGCTNLGFLYFLGRGKPRDVPKAAELFERSCSAGNTTGCANLAIRLLKGQGGVVRDERRARQLLENSCRDDPFACRWLGIIYQDGLGVARDLEKAASYYRQGCEHPREDGARGEACSSLADAYLKGAGVPQDTGRALELLQKGCALESPFACRAHADVYREGKYVAVDHVRANAIAERACEAGVGDSCGLLAYSAEVGRGRPVDVALAARLYLKACDDYESWACENAGNLYYLGTTLPRDPTKGIGLYTRACRLGDGSACDRLGWILKKGEVVHRDLKGALGYFQQACDLGHRESCFQAASMLRKGEGKKDHAAALSIYQRLCSEDSDGESCLRAGEVHLQGDGVPRDGGKGLEFFARACDLGIPDACIKVSDAYRRGQDRPADPAQADAYQNKACSAPQRFRCRSDWSQSLCNKMKTHWSGRAQPWCRR